VRFAARLFDGHDFVKDLTDATGEKRAASITMSISSAPALTASRTSISFTLSEARPDGNDVATDATATGEEPNTERACATRSG